MKKIVILGLVVLISSFSVAPVEAYSCAADDGWFEVRFNVDTKKLPPGVEVLTVFDEATEVDKLYIKNPTQIPFYILDYNPTTLNSAEIVGENAKVKPKHQFAWRVYYKVVDSKAYEHPWFGWEPMEYGYGEKGFELIQHSSWKQFDIELKQVYKDGRPLFVDVPSSHPFEIATYYGKEFKPIVGTIEYSLSHDYLPNRGEECSQAAEEWSNAQKGIQKEVPEEQSYLRQLVTKIKSFFQFYE